MEHCLVLHTGGLVHRDRNGFTVRHANRNVTVFASSVNGNVVITSPKEGLLEVTGVITFPATAAGILLVITLVLCLPFIGLALLAILFTMWNSQKPEVQFQVAFEDFEKRLRLAEKGSGSPVDAVPLPLKPLKQDDHIVCPTCGNRCRIRLGHLGKRVACPKCKTPFTVPPAPPPKSSSL